MGIPAEKKVKGKLGLNASCYLGKKGQADKSLALIGILKILHKHNHKPRGQPLNSFSLGALSTHRQLRASPFTKHFVFSCF